MDARDNESQKLHICTLHILSQVGVCAWVWDSGCTWELPTTSPSHHFSFNTSGPQDLCLLIPTITITTTTTLMELDYLDWKSCRSKAFCLIGKSTVIWYHIVGNRFKTNMHPVYCIRRHPKCSVLFRWMPVRKLLPLGGFDNSFS